MTSLTVLNLYSPSSVTMLCILAAKTPVFTTALPLNESHIAYIVVSVDITNKHSIICAMRILKLFYLKT